MRRVVLLGSTGSIGRQALDVAARLPERLQVVGLAAYSDAATLAEQARQFRPRAVALLDPSGIPELKERLRNFPVEILSGPEGLKTIVELADVDIVLVALLGFAGFLPTLAAIRKGKDIALATKEVLVAGGAIVTREASQHGVRLLPVDSEHSAIFQCLRREPSGTSVRSIILTASGGPFRETPLGALKQVRLADALAHPTWRMGRKITVDSATLMNKGLEVIEAFWLFGVQLDQIRVVIHPQSIIHSMVEFVDGSVLAQLGRPDMRLPIQYALLYPERVASELPRLEIASMKTLTFEEPDLERFPCLALGYRAAEIGGTMPAVLNAANEAAVGLFLRERIAFLDIPRLLTEVMEKHEVCHDLTLETILAADAWARDTVRKEVSD